MTAVWVNGSEIAERVQARAEQAVAAERREQADARDGRRQHERQLDEGDGERVAGEAPRREQVGGRRAEEQDQRLRDAARLERDDEGVLDDGVRELVEQLPGRRVGEDPDDRQREEGERDGGDRDEEAEADPSLHRRQPRPTS